MASWWINKRLTNHVDLQWISIGLINIVDLQWIDYELRMD
jgi:hypothetical protein